MGVHRLPFAFTVIGPGAAVVPKPPELICRSSLWVVHLESPQRTRV